MSAVKRDAVVARVGLETLSLASLGSWTARRWLTAVFAAVLAALLMGVPTGVVQTSFYTRMTPVTWWDYPVWGLSAALAGLIAATYVRAGEAGSAIPDRSRRTLAATLLSSFAIGCPVCNKLIVAVIGVSGALNYWAPLQPLLGLLSLALLGSALVVRLRAGLACPVSSP